MDRLLALFVAAVFATVGTAFFQLSVFGALWDGLKWRSIVGLSLLAVYIYGTALFALWHAIRPIENGSSTLLLLCAPAILVTAYVVVATAVWKTNQVVQDRVRMARAADLWEVWSVPQDPHGIPFVFGDTMLVASANGIFESTDTGRRWTRISDRQGRWGIERWARIWDTLFMASAHELFRSDDGGRSWVMLGVPRFAGRKDRTVIWTGPDGPLTEAVHMLLAGGPDLYLVTYSNVFRSADLGESWTLAFEPDDRVIRETRSLLYWDDALWLASRGGGLLRSVDRGETWTRVEGMPHTDVQSLVTDGRVLYSSGRIERDRDPPPLEILRSSDRGQTWSLVKARSVRWEDGWVGAVGTAMLRLTERGLVSIEPDGTRWSRIPLPGPAGYSSPHGVGRFFGVSGGRLFHLQADGTLWHYGRR